MELSYGSNYGGTGAPGLPFLDPPPAVLERLDHLYPLSDTLDVLAPSSANEPWALRTGLVAPPPYPPVRVNEFYWPAGARRFGLFRGLMAGTDARDLLTRYGVSLTTWLVLDDGAGGRILASEMIVASVRPVFGVSGVTDAYLVTLVDSRWYWRWQNYDWYFAGGHGSLVWTGIVDCLRSSLGLSTAGAAPTVSADYLTAARDSLFCDLADSLYLPARRPPDAMVDAVAANIGCVYTFYRSYPGGGITGFIRHADARAYAESASLAAADRSAAGGLFPIQTSTAAGSQLFNYQCPEWRANAADATLGGYGAGWPVYAPTLAGQPLACYYTTATQASLGAPYDTYKYTFGQVHFSDMLKYIGTNSAEIATLLAKLAKDWFDNHVFEMDETFNGVVDFDTRAACDLLVRWGGEWGPTTTRVSRSPYQWQALDFQHDGAYSAYEHEPWKDAYATNIGGPIVKLDNVSSHPALSGHWVPKSNWAGSGAPTVNDDVGDGYSPGSRWITGTDEYVCLVNTLGAASWKKTTP